MEIIVKAKNENKKLLIDCGADWCSICKAIDKYVFGDAIVKNALCKLTTLKVDATDQDSNPYKTLKEKYPTVKTGEFRATMSVSLVNEGPVTLILEK